MAYKLAALLFLAAQVCSTLALPPCVCGRNLLPVCGSDGQTYANECLLQCENTKRNANIVVAKKSSCDEKDYPRVCICTDELLPVCGSDGVTYPNECELNCQIRNKDNLSLARAGPCDNDCICTKNQKPVCGNDGKTYNNPCLLRCAQKKNPGLSEQRSGPCGENIQLREVQVAEVDPVKVVNN